MATEYKLSYTASEIDRKLATVDETKADLANNYYKSVEVDNKFTEVNENFNTAITKKADLIDGKIPIEQLPDDIGGNNVDLSNYYTKPEADQALAAKADLVNGKVPLTQLPDDIGNGTLVQKQVDYDQNDNEKVDFIKNRPFYDTRIFSHFNSDETPNPVNFPAIGYTWFKISDLMPKDDKIFDTTFTFNNIVLKPTAENISMNTADFCVVLFNLKDGRQQAYLIAYNTGTFSTEYMGMPVTFEIEQTGIYIAWNNAEIGPGKIIDVQVGELKTLDLKYLPENMALGYEDGWSIDWDFTPTNTYIQPGFIIEWDGSDTGTSVVIPENEDLGIPAGNILYRVSDSIETLAGCTVTINTHTEDSEEVLNILAEDVAIIYDADGNDIGTCAPSQEPIVFNIEKAATAFVAEGMEFTFPSPGLYFGSNNEKRVFNLYNIFYEILADGKVYKISDSVNTSLNGSNLSIIVDGQTVQELTLENGGELVLVEQNDGSSAAFPFMVNTFTDNTTFDLSDLAGFPLILTIPEAGLYVYNLMIAFELPEGSSMQLSNSNITKIDSKFLPISGCPTLSGGQLTSRESDYLVYNQQALFASLVVENGNVVGIDYKKGCYNIPSNATEFIISFSGSNLTLDNNLTISIATGYSGAMDLTAYTSDISVEISDLKSLKSDSWYTVYCVYNKSVDAWNGTVVSSAGNDSSLPIATETTLGGIKVGANLSISNDGTLSATSIADWYSITNRPSLYTQSQIDTKLNAKQNTSNLVTSISSSSTNAQYPSAKLLYTVKTDLETKITANTNKYTLPAATSTTLGGIKVGNNLTINNGVLSANISSLSWTNITDKPGLYTQSEVDTKLNTKQNTSNLVTSVNSSSTDTQYPSAKLLYTELNKIVDIAHGGTGYSSITDTQYTTARYRASSLHSTYTPSSDNGVIAWQYE